MCTIAWRSHYLLDTHFSVEMRCNQRVCMCVRACVCACERAREWEVDGGGGGGGRGGDVHRVQRNERTAAAVADSDSFEPESKSAEQRKEKRSRKKRFFRQNWKKEKKPSVWSVVVGQRSTIFTDKGVWSCCFFVWSEIKAREDISWHIRRLSAGKRKREPWSVGQHPEHVRFFSRLICDKFPRNASLVAKRSWIRVPRLPVRLPKSIFTFLEKKEKKIAAKKVRKIWFFGSADFFFKLLR